MRSGPVGDSQRFPCLRQCHVWKRLRECYCVEEKERKKANKRECGRDLEKREMANINIRANILTLINVRHVQKHYRSHPIPFSLICFS